MSESIFHSILAKPKPTIDDLQLLYKEILKEVELGLHTVSLEVKCFTFFCILNELLKIEVSRTTKEFTLELEIENPSSRYYPHYLIFTSDGVSRGGRTFRNTEFISWTSIFEYLFITAFEKVCKDIDTIFDYDQDSVQKLQKKISRYKKFLPLFTAHKL